MVVVVEVVEVVGVTRSCMQWLQDLVSVPYGYGLAACNDKVTASGGIELGATAIRDEYRASELTVVGVSGGNRIFVAFFDAEGPAQLVNRLLSCPVSV